MVESLMQLQLREALAWFMVKQQLLTIDGAGGDSLGGTLGKK